MLPWSLWRCHMGRSAVIRVQGILLIERRCQDEKMFKFFSLFVDPVSLLNKYPRSCLICVRRMALACSQKSLESPFSHVDMYGVQHPSFGKLKCVSRTTCAKTKSRTSIHKGSASKSKVTSRKTVHSSASSTKGHRKKTKKGTESGKATRKPALVKREKSTTSIQGSHSQAHVHSTKSSIDSSLARVDRNSPVTVPRIHVSSSLTSTWKSISRTPSETTSGYSSSKSRLPSTSSRTPISSSNSSAISKSSTVSHSNSAISTTDVLLSLSRSQDSLKSKIMNSPISISLKRVSHTGKGVPPAASCPLFNRSYNTANDLISRRNSKTSGGRRGEALTVEDIVWGLGRLQYRNVIVMSGAGISTSSGIPDFRSPGTGLYDNLQQYKIPDPTAIFDIGYFSRNPRPFFTLAKELYPGHYQPNSVHYFVRLLQEKGLLLRYYTQNIDGLERIAGISSSKLVEAHGSFSTASCIKCKTKQESQEVKGLVKPDIVFFGEDLPARFHSLQLRDFSKCDLLIIMGTSLEVEPFASLCTLPRFDVPRLLINRELVGPFKHSRKRLTDVAVTGDLVESVEGVVEGVGWMEELEGLMRGLTEHETLTVPAGTSLDVQTVASDDAFSSISAAESEPAMLSPIPSDSTLCDPTNTDTLLASQMAGLKLDQQKSAGTETQKNSTLREDDKQWRKTD